MIQRWRQLLTLTALALGLLACVPSAEANGSCKTKIIRDYTGFLGSLPPLPSPPINERLPFAPERVFFHGPGGSLLQAGAGGRSLSLTYSPSAIGATEPTPVLDWQLTMTLTSIDQAGQPLAPSQTIEQHVDRLWPSGEGGANVVRLGFDISGEPAIYRLDIEFENGGGEQLAVFGEYFRVLPPSIDLRASLNRRKFKPGQTLSATLSNYGVAWYGYGYPWDVEYGGPVPGGARLSISRLGRSSCPCSRCSQANPPPAGARRSPAMPHQGDTAL